MRMYRSGTPSRWIVALAVLFGTGCGSSSSGPVVEPDPAVEPFVGDWTAAEFTVTSSADATQTFDVTDGGSFTINVQPSGFYTAIVDFPDLAVPVVESGQLSAVGNSITLRPQGGVAATSSYQFEGPDRLILDGPTEFDFNRDGTLDPANAHIVLERTGA